MTQQERNTIVKLAKYISTGGCPDEIVDDFMRCDKYIDAEICEQCWEDALIRLFREANNEVVEQFRTRR
jgi:hypothetical protein